MNTHLITGSSGFLGSALANKLYDQGENVIGFDNFYRKSEKESSLNKKIRIYNGDIRNLNDLENVFREHKIDTLWHLAYINGTKKFYSDPDLVLEVGVKGTINTLDLALKYNINKYVLASSSEVYNEPTYIPTTEEERIIIPDIHNPRFSYSGGKIISELLTINYAKKKNLNAMIFRPHNIFGPNAGFEHIIPELIKKMVVPEIPIYDSNGDLMISIQGTGDETRAFCYIDDAIEGILLASKKTSIECPIFNIGRDYETSILELIDYISDILQIKVDVVYDNLLQGSTKRRCPDMSKVNKLGYNPQYSLKNGLKITIQWYKKYYEEKYEQY